MEEKFCPFCLSNKINLISDVIIENTNRTRPLMRCGNEKREIIFWDDTGKEEMLIKLLCENDGILKSCKAIRPAYVNDLQKETKRLDTICCDCPDKKFVLQPK